MKQLLLSLITGLSLTVAAQAADVQLGRYLGQDPQGRACEVFLVPNFGSHSLSTYVFTSPSAVYRSFVGKSAPDATGKISSTSQLMADGYVSGRPYWRGFEGAPIFARVIETKYELTFVKNRVVTLRQWRRSLGSQSSYALEECRNLRFVAQ